MPSSLTEVAFIHVSFLVFISLWKSVTVNIDAAQANGFLSRTRRNADPRWHRQYPDFQSYYRYYSSIGHTEGVNTEHIQHARHCTKLHKTTCSTNTLRTNSSTQYVATHCKFTKKDHCENFNPTTLKLFHARIQLIKWIHTQTVVVYFNCGDQAVTSVL